jgi:hypothetical protein
MKLHYNTSYGGGMMEEKWEVVEMVQGQLQAEILRGLLEAQEIKVWLNQEGAGAAYGINVGPLGTVEIMVPTSDLEQARQVLDAYYAGDYEKMNLEPNAAEQIEEEVEAEEDSEDEEEG